MTLLPDATALAAQVAAGEINPDELLTRALARTEALNPRLNAITMIREEAARAAIANGLPDGPFKGVPFLIKDLSLAARDFPSNGGSRLLSGTHHATNSTIFERIRATGLVTFARTTSPEGGIGSATEAAVYGGPTRSPWNPDHTSGGSSGGSAAAVAAGIVPAAHGSDGGGSIRTPASACGLFGFKATRALLPSGPFKGEGWGGMSIDGFLTRSVRDTAALLDAVRGPDLGAPYHAPPLEMSLSQAITADPRPLRIALCDTTFTGDLIHPACAQATQDAGALLESLGHHVEPACPPADHTGMMEAWTKIVACGTALWVRTTCETRGKPLQPGEIEGVCQGAVDYAETVSGADYLAAIAKIHAYGREMAAFLEGYDILLSPTLAEPPAKVGRFNHETTDYVSFRTGPEGIFAYSPFTAPFNASGQPATSVPFAIHGGLPIGIHLAAPFGQDAMLMALSAQIERARPWAHLYPELA